MTAQVLDLIRRRRDLDKETARRQAETAAALQQRNAALLRQLLQGK